MKRLICVLLALLMLGSEALADYKLPEYYDLQPGIYEVGKDIPSGEYDIRFNKLDKFVTITYSYELDENGKPDILNPNSFMFTFLSTGNWWNIGGFLVTLFPGYLEIQDSGCRLWVEKEFN